MQTKLTNQIKGLQAILDQETEYNKTDMEWQIKCIEDATPDQFPILWNIRECGTSILMPGKLYENYLSTERGQYYLASHPNPYEWEINYWGRGVTKEAQWYAIYEDHIEAVTIGEAQDIAYNTFTPILEQWLAEGNSLPTATRIPVRFVNINPIELAHKIQAEEGKKGRKLYEVLRDCHRGTWKMAKNHYFSIYWDKRYDEFCSSDMLNDECFLFRVIKNHGWEGEGYKVNGSVQMTPTYGWASHS